MQHNSELGTPKGVPHMARFAVPLLTAGLLAARFARLR